jgi:hypothetical protein
MARNKKPAGRLSSGPFTADDFHRALVSAGWVLHAKLEHWHYKHPTREGKAQVGPNWDGVMSSHQPFKGICAQTRYSSRELKKLLNGVR